MRKTTGSPAERIRRTGVRVSRGPWVVCVAPSVRLEGRLIAALGRKAGGAVTRSRVRRIAREVFNALRTTTLGIDVVLSARENVEAESRQSVRRSLHATILQGGEVLTRRAPSSGI